MSDDKFTTGSGNIFVDFGFSEEEAADLTIRSYLFTVLQEALSKALESRTQSEVAELMGADQPIISEILNDKMASFSTERIATYLNQAALRYLREGAARAARVQERQNSCLRRSRARNRVLLALVCSRLNGAYPWLSGWICLARQAFHGIG